MSLDASVVFVAALEDEIERARAHSLWRALCHVADVTRIDVETTPPPEAQPDIETPACARRLQADTLSLTPLFRQMRPASLPAVLIVASTREPIVAAAQAAAAATGRRLVLAPARIDALGAAGPAPEADIWVRTPIELQRLPPELQARATVIADAFEPTAMIPEASDPTALAVIVDPGASPDEVSRLMARLAPAAPLRLLASAATLRALQGQGFDTSALIEQRSEGAVLAAPRWLATGGPAELALRAAAAAASGRELETVVAAGGPVPEPALDPQRTRAEVARALGLPQHEDIATVAARLARNLDLRLEVAEARFHPWARQFTLAVDVAGSAPAGALSAELVLQGSDLSLAVAHPVPPRPDFSAAFQAFAPISRTLAPHHVELRLAAWGTPVATLRVLEDAIIQERAGLIALDLASEGRARVLYWGDPETVVQCGRALVSAPALQSKRGRPSTFRAETSFPFNRDSLTPFPARGLGQRFGQTLALAKERLPSTLRLARLQGRSQGRTAWIVGPGAELSTEDLDRIAASGHLCFAIDDFHRHRGHSRLQPAFTVCGDARLVAAQGAELAEQAGGTVVLAAEAPPPLAGDYLWLRQIHLRPALFSLQPHLFVVAGGGSVFAALQVGYYLGVRRWQLYGVDAPTDAAEDELFLPSLHAARQLMELDGGFLRNASRAGHIEALERVDFDLAMADAPLLQPAI